MPWGTISVTISGGPGWTKHALTCPKKRLRNSVNEITFVNCHFFGSVLHGDFRPDSDIDFVVEFDPDHIPGLIRLAGMEIELSEILGRKVDLRTPQDLSRYFRQEVLNSAEVEYAEE